MEIPSATYRIQFSLSFRFADAEALVSYLHDLGISHLYASPRFKARKGSSHGYDVADPVRINSELGTEEEFDRLVARLRQYGMGLLLDIVPNHMAASSENLWWMDVLENGRASRYASFFDIDWEPEGIKLSALEKGRVILPILAAPFSEILFQQGISLRFDDRGFFFQYEDNRLPLNAASCANILELSMQHLRSASESADNSLEELADRCQHLQVPSPESNVSFDERERAAAEIKSALWRLYQTDEVVRRAVDFATQIINGTADDPPSFHHLDRLLTAQFYRLAHWRLAAKEINYRRFFDINHLVGLRVEDPLVFAARHAAIMHLIQEGKVSGLRVDHIDGLLDPVEYLERLRSIPVSGEHRSTEGVSIYTIVEKIMSGGESLSAEWPCCGSTGYDFLNALNALFIDPQGYRELGVSYGRFASIRQTFVDAWHDRKKQVIDELFFTDLDLLAFRLGRLAAADPQGRDVPASDLVLGLAEMTACLPVYRTYYRDAKLSPRDKEFLEVALSSLRSRAPELRDESFHFLRRVFLAELPVQCGHIRELWLNFILRWQQFSSAVMAKGLEDTALFAHHSLISVNEVGASPFHDQIPFGIEAFHRFNASALATHPHTLLATATHDTKWSEDVRARINVLSEVPREWARHLRRWSRLNNHRKSRVDGKLVPTPNEEVIFYQAMLGIWPSEDFESIDRTCLGSRLETFFIKAAREAKTETNWLTPNEAHETALRRFVKWILSASFHDPFVADFLRFHRQIAFLGACNSYSQSILKMTSPGVPDIYQGSEVWNFSLTDPDNRRAVDFRSRQAALETLKARAHGQADSLAELFANWPDGRLKLHITARLLHFRRAHPQLFSSGTYLPLISRGPLANSVFAFARQYENEWLVVVVPRMLVRLARSAGFPLGAMWSSTTLDLPSVAPPMWKDILTGAQIRMHAEEDQPFFPVSQLFHQFPFAVLANSEQIHSGANPTSK